MSSIPSTCKGRHLQFPRFLECPIQPCYGFMGPGKISRTMFFLIALLFCLGCTLYTHPLPSNSFLLVQAYCEGMVDGIDVDEVFKWNPFLAKR